jgi:hypothetical protein
VIPSTFAVFRTIGEFGACRFALKPDNSISPTTASSDHLE